MYTELFKNYAIAAEGKKLVLDSMHYSKPAFRQALNSIALDINDANLTDKLREATTDPKRDALADTIFAELYDVAKQKDLITVPTLDAVEDIPDNLGIVVNAQTGEQIAVDLDKKGPANCSPEVFWAKYSKKEKAQIEDKGFKRVFLEFDPLRTDSLYQKQFEGKQRWFLNRYTPPVWTTLDVKPDGTLLLELLDHLLEGDQKQVDYVCNWLYMAITGVNETALVQYGRKGTAKTALAGVAKALVGRKYTTDSSPSFGTNHFTPEFRDMRLMIMDELRIDEKAHKFLKKVLNNEIAIEGKGKDKSFQEPTFMNYMIVHNCGSDMYVEAEERRFSVLDVTDRPLKEAWSYQKRKRFFEIINKPDDVEVAKIGNYLLERGLPDDFDPTVPYEGKSLHRLIELHLSPCMKAILEFAKEYEGGDAGVGKTNIIKRAKKISTDRYTTNPERVSSQLDIFKYKGLHKMGEVKGSFSEWRVDFNPEFLELILKEKEDGKENS